jgi:broad specificity phosphatase PhoE
MRYKSKLGRMALSLLLIATSACASLHAHRRGCTTVVLVRHAEKLRGGGDDPDLSEAGIARAKDLVAVAERGGVDVIYTTQYRRTRETAAPIAAASHAAVHVININFDDINAYINAVVERIEGANAGNVILVVTHSNTLGPLVERLTGVKVSPIQETEYSRLYIVTLPHKVIAANYGPP